MEMRLTLVLVIGFAWGVSGQGLGALGNLGNLDMSKLAGIFGGNSGGGSGNIFQQLMNQFLKGENPLNNLMNMFNDQAVGIFANQANSLTKKLFPAQSKMDQMVDKLTALNDVVKEADLPEELADEIDYADIPSMIKDAQESKGTILNTRRKMSGLSKGMKKLQQGFRNPEVFQKGMVEMLDLEGEKPFTDTETATGTDEEAEEGVDMLKGMLKGMGKKGDSAKVLENLLRRSAKKKLGKGKVKTSKGKGRGTGRGTSGGTGRG
jgi:hypothetical protein